MAFIELPFPATYTPRARIRQTKAYPMALELLFCTDNPLDKEVYRIASMRWVKQLPNMSVKDLGDGRIQLCYENEDTDVGFSIAEQIGDWTEHLDEAKLAEIRNLIGERTLCDWQFTLNFFRPGFFAREAMPYVAEFARLNGLSILDPESAEFLASDEDELVDFWQDRNSRAIASVLFEDDEAEMTVYSAPLGAIGDAALRDTPTDNNRFYLNAQGGLEFTIVDAALLERCWQYNLHKATVQAETDIFIPKIMLLQLTQDQPFSDIFIWTRTCITAVPETEYVLMASTDDVSEDSEFEYGIARGRDLREMIAADTAEWHEDNGYLLPPLDGDPVGASTDFFDRCWNEITQPHDPKKCALLGGFMCVVETELINELSAKTPKH